MRSSAVGLALAIAACGPMHKATNDPNVGSDGKQAEMVCHDTSDTGSLMRHQECQPRNHTTSDDDRKDTENLLGKPRSAPTNAH